MIDRQRVDGCRDQRLSFRTAPERALELETFPELRWCSSGQFGRSWVYEEKRAIPPELAIKHL